MSDKTFSFEADTGKILGIVINSLSVSYTHLTLPTTVIV